MKNDYNEFNINQPVYWTRKKDGLYIIKDVYKRQNMSPLLLIQKVFSLSYDRETGNVKDRQYEVDATYCKIVDLKTLLAFEEEKLTKVKKMISYLESLTDN